VQLLLTCVKLTSENEELKKEQQSRTGFLHRHDMLDEAEEQDRQTTPKEATDDLGFHSSLMFLLLRILLNFPFSSR
jgi:hypothetical protein